MKKIISLVGIIFLLTACRNSPSGTTNNTLQIISTDTLLGIHAKKILQENSHIDIKNIPLSTEEKNLFLGSPIMVTTSKETSDTLSPLLQEYRGLLITLPAYETNTLTYPLEVLTQQIEILRDAFSDINPENRSYYHNQSGEYIYLLKELDARLSERMKEYTPSSFLTLGGGLDNFIQRYNLNNFYQGNYESISEITENAEEVQKLITGENIQSIFVRASFTDKERKLLENEFGLQTFVIPEISDDTSGWGYMRHLEKIMNAFVAAFDTYD